MTVNGTISGKGVSSIINIGIGRQLLAVVSGTWIGAWRVERQIGNAWEPVTLDRQKNDTITVDGGDNGAVFRINRTVASSGDLDFTLSELSNSIGGVSFGDLPGADLDTGDTYSDAAVKAAIDGVAQAQDEINEDVSVKLNEIILALRAKGIIDG